MGVPSSDDGQHGDGRGDEGELDGAADEGAGEGGSDVGLGDAAGNEHSDRGQDEGQGEGREEPDEELAPGERGARGWAGWRSQVGVPGGGGANHRTVLAACGGPKPWRARMVWASGVLRKVRKR